MTEPLLKADELVVEVQGRSGSATVVDNVTMAVPRGEAFGLVGESGCGKSMTLRAVMGILPRAAQVTHGRVLLNGADLMAMPRNKRREIQGKDLAMVFQEPMSALNPTMKIGDQIAEGPIVHLGLRRARAREHALELMQQVGIPDPARRAASYPQELSGGMRQRAMIAMALACDPQLLLCDEPTTALDATIQDQILRLLMKLCSERDVSLILVTHDLPVIAETCRSMAVMYAGQIVESGPVEEVLHQPRHPYTLRLLRSVPQVDHARADLIPIRGQPPSMWSLPPGCRFHPRCDFATEECTQGVFPLRHVTPDHATACIHDDKCVSTAMSV